MIQSVATRIASKAIVTRTRPLVPLEMQLDTPSLLGFALRIQRYLRIRRYPPACLTGKVGIASTPRRIASLRSTIPARACWTRPPAPPASSGPRRSTTSPLPIPRPTLGGCQTEPAYSALTSRPTARPATTTRAIRPGAHVARRTWPTAPRARPGRSARRSPSAGPARSPTPPARSPTAAASSATTRTATASAGTTRAGTTPRACSTRPPAPRAWSGRPTTTGSAPAPCPTTARPTAAGRSAISRCRTATTAPTPAPRACARSTTPCAARAWSTPPA
mmetsp:Transcript_72239/g.193204  ORF Transcript_72239/g.193204 Transcript_72239/m.193204 type:complete len:277 (+) Transcript_72239:319-1149(+)